MTIYVETNFLLEVALGQEQAEAAGEILAHAERGEFELAVPAFSLAEPFSTVTHRHRDRRQLASALSVQAKDLLRSAPHQQDALSLEPLVGVLVQIGRRETDRLVSTVERLLTVATIVQVDLPIFQNAMRYRATHELSEQDAIIYAAIVSHLAGISDTGPHYFVSKNSKDFNIPGIAQELSQLACTFVADFNLMADILRHERQPIE